MHESELARPVQICVNEFVALSKVFTERLVIVFEGLPYTFKEHTVTALRARQQARRTLTNSNISKRSLYVTALSRL